MASPREREEKRRAILKSYDSADRTVETLITISTFGMNKLADRIVNPNSSRLKRRFF